MELKLVVREIDYDEEDFHELMMKVMMTMLMVKQEGEMQILKMTLSWNYSHFLIELEISCIICCRLIVVVVAADVEEND